MPPTDAHSPIDYDFLDEILKGAKNKSELHKLIVNTPFNQYKLQTTFLFLGIIVLLLVDESKQWVERVALSDTELAQRTVEVSPLPFEQIKIRLNDKDNIVCKAIKTNSMQDTTDWKTLFTPTLNAKQARINQANAGIAYSAVYPLKANSGGALIYSYFQYREMINEVQIDFMEQYTKYVNEALKLL
ncbi:MAG: hypothetical protein ACHQT9_03645 [Candidatus Saccharimonadales bacterium]